MKILFAASECAPFIKSGGLGDVAAALPKALAKEKNTEVSVFLPYYQKIKNDPSVKVEFLRYIYVKLAWRDCYCGIFRLKSRSRKLQYYFIDNEYYFKRGSMYGDLDDGERFAFFSKAVLESAVELGLEPRIIHCNDWQTALIPVLVKSDPARYGQFRTVLTIHNIEYQGIAGSDFAKEVLGLDQGFAQMLELDGCTNFLKGGLVACDKITTVSPTYSEEILDEYFAHGLEKILNENRYKLCGILNGIDTELFDPMTDENLPVNYGPDAPEGKAECKKKLQEELGLDVRPDVPMIAIVSRLASHKGIELIETVIRDIAESDVQLVVLGTGEGKYEGMFSALAGLYPNKISANIAFSVSLASRIYAGADFLLMPSKSEPCGLAQMIAMRYGTLPIVRETGGLRDTVYPVDPGARTGRGVTFKSYNAYDMLDAVRRAAAIYYDRECFETVSRGDMSTDFSWKSSVIRYLEAYGSVSL